MIYRMATPFPDDERSKPSMISSAAASQSLSSTRGQQRAEMFPPDSPRVPAAGPFRVVVAAVLILAAATPPTVALANEREAFLAAESALEQGDVAVFTDLVSRLRDYPLYPYLRFQALRRDLDRATGREVEAFLAEHGDTPLADRIRRAWLKRLAARGQWGDYARLYVADDSTERRCLYLRSLLETDRASEALGQVEPLWRVGRSQPAACDPVFDAWRASGGLTQDLVWERIALAMDANQTRLARFLGKSLPMDERAWLDRWLRLEARPDQVLDLEGFSTPHPRRDLILAHGVERLAETSPSRAAYALDRLTEHHDLGPMFTQRAAAAVGLALAEDGERAGLDFLDRVVARDDNLELQERRLRAALRLQAWDRVATWVAAMPDGERKSEHWNYWQARALEALGQPDLACQRYREAAGERSLWGFLAAERTGRPYRLEHHPAPVAEAQVERMANGAPGLRIAELRALGRDLDARREFFHLIRDLPADDLKAAAVLAQRWAWPDQAIFTLAKSGYWDDLELRFPLLHQDLVRAEAQASGLDASWIYAILRQESAFNPRAISHAGAVGLMQLMPATAAATARRLELPRPSRTDLYDPMNNVALGSSYLASVQRRFDGHPVLAAAAYNAGPHRVAQWLPSEPVAADLWVATIPFRETRGYVRRVLAYRVIYDHRLGRDIEPLSTTMRPIGRGPHLDAFGASSPTTTENPCDEDQET